MKYTSIKTVIGLSILLLNLNLTAQEDKPTRYTSTNKGKFFISWGGNRETFSRSDITFKGDDYNFTIDNVQARDKPKGWHIDYINPTRITIPQTNAKLGYFISDNYTISIGLDHMKYVMSQYQTANVSGTINLPADQEGSQFNGSYNNTPVVLTKDFLEFEHTNGLNYIYTEFARYDDISSIFGVNNTDVFQLNITEGLGAGILYPKTNTTLLLKERYDQFNIAGYGISINAGLNFTFFKHYFFQTDLRGGYINMPNVRTTNNTADSASHDFFYLQRVISFGAKFKFW